jgi:pilus assembly protein CpaB
MSSRSDGTAGAAPGVPTTGLRVLVSGADIQPGTAVGAGALRWQPWPEDMKRPEYVAVDTSLADVDAQQKAALDRFVGLTARRLVAAGEPMTDALVFSRDTAGFMAGALADDMRAIAVPLPQETSSGFILPGDRVDMILSHDVTKSLPKSVDEISPDGGVSKRAAETVVENARVLAVDQTAARDAEGEPIVAKTVTVEVTPEQAEVLVLAREMGTLTVALRSLGASVSAAGRGFVGDVHISPALSSALIAARQAVEERAAAERPAAPPSLPPAPASAPPKVDAPKPEVPGWKVLVHRGSAESHEVSGN